MRNDPYGEINFGEVKRRSLTGVLSLISRSFLVQIISFVSTFLLTIFLEPQVFGIFFLVSALVNFFAYFSDIGLAAALIQKKEKLEEEDLKTTFTVQQILVLILIILIIGVSPLVARMYSLSRQAVFLVYALGVSLFFSSLKTIPSVLLERNLRFDLLVIPQIVETLIFNILAVFLAWKGFGITSFTIAVLSRGLAGLILIYLIQPWSIGISFSLTPLSKLLKFGLPYQANTIIAVLKDDLMTVFLGKVVGTQGLGYLGWAKRWAEQPLRFFMDNVLKVTFPAYSRLQDNKEALKKAVEKSLFFLCFFTFPILVGFSVLASDLVKIIPKYIKWQPALFALYLYCFNSGWAILSTSMTNLLNAVGKIKTTFKLMLMWLILTWSIMPILGVKFGYNGVAMAVGIISLFSVIPISIGKKIVDFDLFDSTLKPFFSSLIMGVFLHFFRPSPINIWISFLIRVIFGGFIYLVLNLILFGEKLRKDIAFIFKQLKKQ